MNDLGYQLGQLERMQLIRKLDDLETAYQFKHALSQDATYQSLLVKTRRDIHLRVALYYEQLYANAPDIYAPLLAHHYNGAGDAAKTFHYAIVAGDAAARLYAHAEALLSYDLALDILRQITRTADFLEFSLSEISGLYTNRGRVFELTNRYDRATENYLEMEMAGRVRGISELELSGMTLRAILLSTFTSEFDPEQARALNDRILARARELGDRAFESKVLWIMLLLDKYSAGNLTAAIEHGERSLTLARELGLREQMAYVLNDIAFPYTITGGLEFGRAALEEAVTIWQELANLALLSDTYGNLVPVRFYLGEISAAKQASAEALRLGQLTGSLWAQAYSQMWVGPIYVEQGEYGAGLRVMEASIHTAEAAQFLPPQVLTRSDLAWFLSQVGQFEQAFVEVERAQQLVEGIRPFAVFTISVQIRFALLAGDVDAAERLSNLDLFRAGSPFKQDPHGMSRVALAEGELALAKREYTSGLMVIEPTLQFLNNVGVKPYVADLLYLKARILYAQGDSIGALDVVAEALERVQPYDFRQIEWQLLALSSEIETAREHFERAYQHRVRAREIVIYILDHIHSETLERSFSVLPRVQSILRQV